MGRLKFEYLKALSILLVVLILLSNSRSFISTTLVAQGIDTGAYYFSQLRVSSLFKMK